MGYVETPYGQRTMLRPPASTRARKPAGTACARRRRAGVIRYGLSIGVLRLPVDVEIAARDDHGLRAQLGVDASRQIAVGGDVHVAGRVHRARSRAAAGGRNSACRTPAASRASVSKRVLPPRTPSREGDWTARTISTLFSSPFSMVNVASAFGSANRVFSDAPCKREGRRW